MLEEINISNLGIIKTANLPFTHGLNVITGETGAGKTMVLSALNLLLGKRSNANMVYTDATNLSVEGCWDVTNNATVSQLAEDTGAIIEDATLFINRTVKQDGKSRAVVGGKTTPATILSKIGENLVSIHGQSDQMKLKSPTAQREVLDQYAGSELATQIVLYKKLYGAWKEKVDYLKDIEQNASNSKREINAIITFKEDFEQLSPYVDEDIELERTINELLNLDNIREGLSEAINIIEPPDSDHGAGLMDLLELLERKLAKMADYGDKFKNNSDNFSNIINTTAELFSEIKSQADDFDTDSIEVLYSAQEREKDLKTLVKRYGSNLNEVIEQYAKVETQLEELEKYNQPIDKIQKEVEQAYAKALEQADKISLTRKKYAQKMSIQVNTELSGLNMSGTTFIINATKGNLTSSGQDTVAFMLQQKGSTKQSPIDKTASGGELSRIMLSIEVALSHTNIGKTFVFDEIDSGVGGETAAEIGKRLSLLARDSQVIVVTHLPQVAAYANNHLKVVKTEYTNTIETEVMHLNHDERINEIARMLSGMSDSSFGQAHAAELIEHSRII